MTTVAAESTQIREKKRPIETIGRENGEDGGERRELRPISSLLCYHSLSAATIGKAE